MEHLRDDDHSIVAIVVNFNGSGETLSCVASLRAQDRVSMRIVVADNGSTQADIDVLEAGLPPEADLYLVGQNIGYAGAINCVVKRDIGHARYFLLLNNDVVLTPGAVRSMLTFLAENPQVAIGGPVVVDYNEPNRIRSAGARIVWTRGTSVALFDGAYFEALPKMPRVVDYVAGCTMLVRADAFGIVGLLDESYFMYGEEKEFCMRARRHGLQTVCIPSSVILHKNGATARRYPGLKTYYMTRNRFNFMKKYASVLHVVSFLFFVILVEPFSYFTQTPSRALGASIRWHFRGVFSGIKRFLGP